ncbi:hypothetical protein GQ56_0111650 [Burkholderia paludis]|nr:hypothetical protein GQ56_0111650 [Burkholderia paludis]
MRVASALLGKRKLTALDDGMELESAIRYSQEHLILPRSEVTAALRPGQFASERRLEERLLTIVVHSERLSAPETNGQPTVPDIALSDSRHTQIAQQES